MAWVVGMTNDDATQSIDRVPLNLRIDKGVKKAYEGAIRREHGAKSPYCGIELERELRFRLDDSRSNEIWANITSLSEEFGQQGYKEKIPQPERIDTTVVRYQIAENVRSDIIKLAEEESYRSAGAFVGSIMHSYATGRSIEERLVDRTDRILQAAQAEHDDELSAVGRRTKKIAQALEAIDGCTFTLDEFDDALQEAKGIESTAYTLKEYLPRVLEDLDYTWSDKTDEFVDADTIDTERRDPRKKPYKLMNESDRRLAIKYELYTLASQQSGDQALINITEAIDVLQGRPQKKTVKQLLRDIGRTGGFSYDDGSNRANSDASDALKIDLPSLRNAPGHADLLALVDLKQSAPINDDSSSPDGGSAEVEATDTELVEDSISDENSDWKKEVINEVEHVSFEALDLEDQNIILKGQIAKKKYVNPDEFDHEDTSGDSQIYAKTLDESRLSELETKVADDDLDAVRRELGLSSISEASRDEIDDDVDESDRDCSLDPGEERSFDGDKPERPSGTSHVAGPLSLFTATLQNPDPTNFESIETAQELLMVVIGIGLASLALAIIATWGDSPIPVGVGVVAGIITVFE